MGQHLSAMTGRLTSRRQENPNRETPEERRNNLIQQARGRECKGLEGRLEVADLEEIMRQKKPPTSLEKLVKAACLKKLEDVRNVGSALADAVEPHAYENALQSVKQAGGYLPKTEEQKMEKEKKKMEKERKWKQREFPDYIGQVVGKKCKGLDGELQDAEVRRIMESEAPARSADELYEMACLQRLKEMEGDAKALAIESVRANGGFLPLDLRLHEINDKESARSDTELLKRPTTSAITKKSINYF